MVIWNVAWKLYVSFYWLATFSCFRNFYDFTNPTKAKICQNALTDDYKQTFYMPGASVWNLRNCSEATVDII